ILALVVLRRGFVEGLSVAAIAGVAMLALYSALGVGAVPVGGVALITWLPVLVMAAVLRSTSSQARALSLAAVFGCGAVAGIFAAAGDPAAVWEQVLREEVLPLLERAGMSARRDLIQPAVPAMAAMLTGLAAAFWALGH